MDNLPRSLKKYFWDVNFGKLRPQNRQIYIIKRILEYGDKAAVEWMFKKAIWEGIRKYFKQEVRKLARG